ncbi:hypothetical protein Ddc_10825 [Ditylenchus destructor]|nr:hypothetical protein Ddc_10825 [Ditylenchus destructor]
MRYTIFDSLNTENGTVLHKAAKKFDCENRKYLENFQLLDKNKIGDVKAEFPKVFVIAGNVDFFPSMRAVIASIQNVFFKDKFQSSYRIIIYDLDGISKDTSKKMELMRVCNLEFRIFDWKQLPENVHNLKIFAWKVIILAVSG